MKSIHNLVIVVLVLTVFSCASGSVTQNAGNAVLSAQLAYSENSLTIDTAISSAASYFAQRLPASSRVALVSFDTPSGSLSNYIFEEMWSLIEDSGFIMVDRRNLQRIENEIMHQYGTGMVDDNLMVSLSKQAGAQILIYGHLTSLSQS